MNPLESLAANLPPALCVEEQTPALFWVTVRHQRRVAPPWVQSDTYRSAGYFCLAPQKPLSRCFPPRS